MNTSDRLPPVVYASLTTLEPPGDDFDASSMGVACLAVLVEEEVYYFKENELEKGIGLLSTVEKVVGVNDFLLKAVSNYRAITGVNFKGIQTEVSKSLGKRVSLNNIAKNTVGKERPDHRGLPLEWKSGRKKVVKKALKKDVLLIRELHEEIKERGKVTVTDPETLEEVEVEMHLT